jgi:hypothetical protein
VENLISVSLEESGRGKVGWCGETRGVDEQARQVQESMVIWTSGDQRRLFDAIYIYTNRLLFSRDYRKIAGTWISGCLIT